MSLFDFASVLSTLGQAATAAVVVAILEDVVASLMLAEPLLG